MFRIMCFLVLLFSFLTLQVLAQPIQAVGRDKLQIRPFRNSMRYPRPQPRCSADSQFRSTDGTCTNPDRRKSIFWGASNLRQFSYFNTEDTSEPVGGDLPSARFLSNTLFDYTKQVFDPRGLNEFSVFCGWFIAHTIASTPSNASDPLPIEIPKGDPLLRQKKTGKLIFQRSVRAESPGRNGIGPQNALTSAIDLASVYGAWKNRNNVLRPGVDGLMRTSEGNLLPLNTVQFNNAPDFKSQEYFLAGDHRSNAHPVLTAIHTLFLREHNSLAVELKKAYPEWPDRFLYETARKINGAQMQKVVFKEWYPAMTGSSLPKYKGFKGSVNPTVSALFSTVALRVGHTMVGNQVNRRGPENVKLDPIPFQKMFYRMAKFIRERGIEEFLRGALVSRAEKVDLQVSEALRNFLFTAVPGLSGVDLVALDIQRGRDHGVPSYNAVREKFGFRPVTSFKEITQSETIISKLSKAYKSHNDVEAFVGLLAEDHAPGSSLGPTMLKIWTEEFTRLRDGDFFYYEKPGLFSRELIEKIPRIKALFTDEEAMRAIILRNSQISKSEMPSKTFFQ